MLADIALGVIALKSETFQTLQDLEIWYPKYRIFLNTEATLNRSCKNITSNIAATSIQKEMVNV